MQKGLGATNAQAFYYLKIIAFLFVCNIFFVIFALLKSKDYKKILLEMYYK